MSKTDFDNKLTSFNKRIISNKIKHLEVQKKLNSRIKYRIPGTSQHILQSTSLGNMLAKSFFLHLPNSLVNILA